MNLQKNNFTAEILHWNKNFNFRQMPWKGLKDPYKIWLSEVILQQTRVEQGLPYYNKFIKAYPTVARLATADVEEVYKLWEGLGYYSRCRNMHATAKIIHERLGNNFPQTMEGLLKLPGIGSYTAAAIGSFAFELPAAVVDGNVIRVLARYFGIADAFDTTAGKKIFTQLADNLIDITKPAVYNQAIMDFGAIVCKPKLPLCKECILQQSCAAFNRNMVYLFPVRANKLVKKYRYLTYIVYQYKQEYFIAQRLQNDIWQNLFQFVLAFDSVNIDVPEDEFNAYLQQQLQYGSIIKVSKSYKQVLTHLIVHAKFITVACSKRPDFKGGQWVNKFQLSQKPFPVIANKYMAHAEMIA